MARWFWGGVFVCLEGQTLPSATSPSPCLTSGISFFSRSANPSPPDQPVAVAALNLEVRGTDTHMEVEGGSGGNGCEW